MVEDLRDQLRAELTAINQTILEVVKTPEDMTSFKGRVFQQKRLSELYATRDRIAGELAVQESIHGGSAANGIRKARFVAPE